MSDERSDSRCGESQRPAGICRILFEQIGGLIIGALFGGIGLVTVLSSADVIPTPDANFGAPRWIVGLVGIAFLAAGAVIWCGVAMAASRRAWQQALVRGIAVAATVTLVLSMVVTALVFLSMKLLDPAGADGVVLVGGLPLPARVRGLVVRGAILLCLTSLVLAIVLVCWNLVAQVAARIRRR